MIVSPRSGWGFALELLLADKAEGVVVGSATEGADMCPRFVMGAGSSSTPDVPVPADFAR